MALDGIGWHWVERHGLAMRGMAWRRMAWRGAAWHGVQNRGHTVEPRSRNCRTTGWATTNHG
eukprot:5608172-Lingulodinium_polyedra.AAC.1